jgi:hypothetical protein
MTDRLSAYVVADSGSDFTCEITNLTPRSLFLCTDETLPFQEQVSVVFFSVEVRGEVALESRSPRGLLIVFDASPAIRRRIEGHMAGTRQVFRPLEERPAIPRNLDEASATEVVEMEVELIHGLTSHAAQRPSSQLFEHDATVPEPGPPRETVQARPRKAQEAKLDNVVVAPRRRKRLRDQETTDLDPSSVFDDVANS